MNTFNPVAILQKTLAGVLRLGVQPQNDADLRARKTILIIWLIAGMIFLIFWAVICRI